MGVTTAFRSREKGIIIYRRVWKGFPQEVTLELGLRFDKETLGRGNSMHLIPVLGGVSQITFAQGCKLFFFKK